MLITADAGRLWRAEQLGLLQPIHSAILDARIPPNFRDPGGQWYGFSLRARVIAYGKAKMKPEEVPTYESLAEPKWKGRICVRSGTHIYNLSLLASMIEHLGKQKAEAWAKAVNRITSYNVCYTKLLRSQGTSACDSVASWRRERASTAAPARRRGSSSM